MVHYEFPTDQWMQSTRKAIEYAVSIIIKAEVKIATEKVTERIMAMMPRIEAEVYKNIDDFGKNTNINVLVKMIIEEKTKEQ